MTDTATAASVLDHVTIHVRDFAAAVAFYDATLGALGLQRVIELGDEEEPDADVEAAGWGTGEHAVIWLVQSTPATTRVQLSLRAGDPEAVRAFHAAALEHGGGSHDAPRRWPIYRRGQFAAQVSDPEGNLVEAVAPE